LIGMFVGNATEVANFVFTWVRWPSGDTGAVTMRSEKPLLSILATSNTRRPSAPLAV
jgi:hypothetical protein